MQRKIEGSIEDLDYSSADCQLLIHKYTGLVYELTQRYDIVAAENEVLHQQLEPLRYSQINVKNDSEQDAASGKFNTLCPECINIQRSLSWRITKPLRMVKQISLFLKHGFIFIIKKGRGKFKQ